MRDIYGRMRTSQLDDDVPVPYEVETVTDSTTVTKYTRFFDAGTKPCGIQKETTTTDSSTTNTVLEFAFAPWADRATATYVPINECWNVK